MFEVLLLPKINSQTFTKLKLEPKIFSSLYMRKMGYPENLKKIRIVLNTLAEQYNYPVIVSTHPRTRKRLENLDGFQFNPLVKFLKPFSFTDYNYLQMNSTCVISDSGTISEESAILKFPAITIRNSMERPEALDAGTIILSGFDPEVVLDAIKVSTEEGAKYTKICPEYEIDNFSKESFQNNFGDS